MAIRGLTLSSTLDYISDMDPGKDPKTGKPLDGATCTVFTLGPVDVFVTGQVFDRGVEFFADADPRVNMNAMNLEYVRFGLRNMTGFEGGDGKPVTFETVPKFIAGRAYQVISDNLLAQIPLEVVRELGQEIKNLSTVSVDEAKNS